MTPLVQKPEFPKLYNLFLKTRKIYKKGGWQATNPANTTPIHISIKIYIYIYIGGGVGHNPRPLPQNPQPKKRWVAMTPPPHNHISWAFIGAFCGVAIEGGLALGCGTQPPTNSTNAWSERKVWWAGHPRRA